MVLGVVFVGCGHSSPAPNPSTPTTQPAATARTSTVQPVSVTPSPTPTQPASHTATSVDVTQKPVHIAGSPTQTQTTNQIQTEHVYRAFGTTNDPALNPASQYYDWSLDKTNAKPAWDIATGGGGVIVADIDTGYAMTHPDLVNQWYVNPGETGTTAPGDKCWTGTPQNKQANSCDDDDNGYVDDWRGWNFVLGDNNPQTGRQNPYGNGVSHGSSTAGLIGATGNNHIGSSAINQNVSIMPLVALGDNGSGYTSYIVAAINYAVANGAHVINMSLGSYADDSAMRNAVNNAINHGVVIVAASGNCGNESDTEDCPMPTKGVIAYPAAYPQVIAVGATTQSDSIASFSSFGPAIDVSAPGNLMPILPGWDADLGNVHIVNYGSGTSYAAPQVTSLVSLIKSIRPASTVADITALINATARKPSGLGGLVFNEKFGHGIIDSHRALVIAQILNAQSNVPMLLQAGSHASEHTTPAGASLGSGCLIPSGGACTIQITSDTSHTRYLPYQISDPDGQTGWTWLSNNLSNNLWQIRAQSGNDISDTPYWLFKKS